MNRIQSILMSIIKSEILDIDLDKSIVFDLSCQDLIDLYNISKIHDLAHIVGDGLLKNNLITDADLQAAFRKETFVALQRYSSLQAHLDELRKLLVFNNIPFIVLKGSVIRPLYKKPWMRTSCDIDILIKEEDKQKAKELIVEQLGYSFELDNYHDISLHSKHGIHLELHFSIQENMENIDRLLSKCWDYAVKKNDDTSEYEFVSEYFMYHQFAHAYYHFKSGGCGIRPIIDIYVLNNCFAYEIDKLNKLLVETNITVFSNSLVKLSKVWFEDEKPSELVEMMQTYIFDGGIYGSHENSVKSENARKGKMAVVLNKVWLPYTNMCVKYPILKKYKILLPIFEVIRWFSIFNPSKRNKHLEDLKITAQINDEQLDTSKKMFDMLGMH